MTKFTFATVLGIKKNAILPTAYTLSHVLTFKIMSMLVTKT